MEQKILKPYSWLCIRTDNKSCIGLFNRTVIGTFLAFFFLFHPITLNARQGNFIESHLLRLSQSQDIENWTSPRAYEPLASSRSFFFESHAGGNTETIALYSLIKKKDKEKLEYELANLYGTPLEASLKIHSSYDFGFIKQSFVYAWGTAVTVNDPVFPELKGILFNDIGMRSEYTYPIVNGPVTTLRLTYGLRRLMDQSFTVGELLDKRPNLRFKSYPYRFFMDWSPGLSYSLKPVVLFTEFQSLPIVDSSIDYWAGVVGVRTLNLSKLLEKDWIENLHAWVSISPLFGGNYSVARTLQLGAMTKMTKYFQLTAYMHDFLPAGEVRVLIDPVELSLYTYSRSYDEARTQFNRSWGLSLRASF